jgi:hypothetical protein
MIETKLDRGVIFALRVLVGWTFLYAGTWQILQDYSAAAFLNHVVMFLRILPSRLYCLIQISWLNGVNC